MTPSETTALIDKHLSGWLGVDHDSPTLRDRIAAMIAEAEKKRDELWQAGNNTLRHERNVLSIWKHGQLTVESWWHKIDEFVRAHPDSRLGESVADMALEFLKERDELKDKLKSTWKIHDEIVENQAKEIRNNLLTIAVLKKEVRVLVDQRAAISVARDDAVQAAHLIAEELGEVKELIASLQKHLKESEFHWQRMSDTEKFDAVAVPSVAISNYRSRHEPTNTKDHS